MRSTRGDYEVSSARSEIVRVQSAPEPQLFPRRATMIYPTQNGKDLAFTCYDHTGQLYYCKPDSRGQPVRAIELIFTRLAERLGIRTADCAQIEYEGQTYFGSKAEISAANHFAAVDFLSRPRQNELGQPYPFPGEHLAQVLAFDLFTGNPDRGPNNFLLVQDGGFLRLCAIDFADARFSDLVTKRFPVATSTTVIVGKRYRMIHGEYVSSAIEMVDRIGALPAPAFSRIVAEVPDSWLSNEAKGGLCEVWGSPDFCKRLNALRLGLSDGTLV